MFNKEYLFKENTTALKGIFAVFIVLAHLYTNTRFADSLISNVRVLQVINMVAMAMGYLSCAVFFFLSGFGLMAQYEKRKERYIKDFPKKRLLTLYSNCLILIGIYSVIRYVIVGEQIKAKTFLQSFLFGGTIIKFGWYLQVILLCYLIFYFAFKLCMNKDMGAATVLGATVLYCIVAASVGLESTWYEGVLAFPLGILWNRYQDRIDRVLESKFIRILILSFILFALGFILANFSFLGQFNILAKILCSLSFVVAVVALTSRISVNNKLTHFLGKYSLEIYVTQGAALLLLKNRLINIENNFLYMVAVLVLIAIFALSVHPLFKITNRLICNMGDKKYE